MPSEVEEAYLTFFYHKLVYVGDGCVKYHSIELKDNNDVRNMFFIFSEFSSKEPIKLYAMVGQSPKDILGLLHKTRKPRFVEEIIALMYGSIATSSNEDDNFVLVFSIDEIYVGC